MKKASVESDAETDDSRLGRAVLALMEAHRARTAEPSAPSPQLAPPAGEEAPPTQAPPASADSLATDLSDRASPDPPPRLPLGVGGPNIEFPPRLEPRQFDSSFAINEARTRSSPESDVVPLPRVPTRGGASRWIGGLILLILIAAILAYGLVLIAPRDQTAIVPPSDKPATPEVAGPPAAGKQREEPGAIPRLIAEDRRAYVNEPLRLGLSLDGASGGEFLLIKGLNEATRFSAGTLVAPNSWRVSAADIGNLFVHAPEDYVGTMDAVVDLHTADNRKVDSQRIKLEWVPVALPSQADVRDPPERPPVQAPLEKLKLQPDEIAVLLQRGKEMLNVGDISAARPVLRRAAEAENAEAAFLLASTFDPIELNERGVVGFAPNLSQALAWYRKASALGSGDAMGRIERLERTSR